MSRYQNHTTEDLTRILTANLDTAYDTATVSQIRAELAYREREAASEWVNPQTGEVVSQDIMSEWLEKIPAATDSVRHDEVASSTVRMVHETTLDGGELTGTFQLMTLDAIAALFSYPSDLPVRDAATQYRFPFGGRVPEDYSTLADRDQTRAEQ
jgi:hypothetical protein